MERRRLTAILAFAAALVTGPGSARGATVASVDFTIDLTRIDGFGASEAFQRAAVMHGLFGLTPEHQQEVVDLLFNRETGAGLSILRLGIGSSPLGSPYDLMMSIQPVDPGGPSAPPQYVWDGDDGGQLWLAKEAQKYGVRRFYANAWSAPGYMKTNGSDKDGGTLCGVLDAVCESGDWRQAYADYLLQYVRFYRDEGVQITDLAFTNEPDLTLSYASMRFTDAQAIDFLKVLGPRVAASGLPLSITCCDASKWRVQTDTTRAIEADPVARQIVNIHAGHEYGSLARSPLPTAQTTWMSEYALSGWNPNWDAGAAASSGIALANDIHDTLVLADVNAYIAWTAVSIGQTTGAWIQADSPGSDYRVSKRLWAMAAYSRYIRPGAFRVLVSSLNYDQKVSAFRNADGSKVINIINNAAAAVAADLSLDPGTAAGAGPVSYLTDETHSLERVNNLAHVTGQTLSVSLAPRSLTTIVLPPSGTMPASCGRTSTGLIPLNDAFMRSYQGMAGGLYPGGSNHRPASHEAAGLRLGAEVRPRDPGGAADAESGKIALLSIGMSNTTQEFSAFKELASTDPEKNPRLVIVDGAQGGWTADKIVLTGDEFWATVDARLAAAGVTAAQVQIGWLKEALAQPDWTFPEDTQRLQSYLKSLVRILRSRFPNLRLLYLSSRIYGGYASTDLNPEPYAYQSAFSVKWLIEEQLNGNPDLSFDAGQAPWLSWGPYLWADGTREREDALVWECSDFQSSDGTHPSESGRQKVAVMLLDFLKSDSTARPWFVRPAQPETPRPVPDVVVNAADYSGLMAAGSLASIYGSELSASIAVASTRPFPSVLAGTVVRIGGEPVPLYYVSPGQINFYIPTRPAGGDVVVVRDGIASPPFSLSAVISAPAIFTMGGWPDGPAAATHADGRVVTPEAPAEPGESITVFLTGLGWRNTTVLSITTVMPVARVGEQQAQVNTARLAPGFPGLDHINFRVPSGAAQGNAWLTIGTGLTVSKRAALAVGKATQAAP